MGLFAKARAGYWLWFRQLWDLEGGGSWHGCIVACLRCAFGMRGLHCWGFGGCVRRDGR